MPTTETLTLAQLTRLLKQPTCGGLTITRHGYRQQRVVGDAVTEGPINYNKGDDFDRLQHLLAAAAGDSVNNHETYEVVTPDGQKLCLWFHDWVLYVGTATVPYC